MSYSLDVDDLTAYPGVRVSSSATAALVVRLVEGKINGVIGDVQLSDEQLADVDSIAFEVGARALSNPTGATSITTGIDDWKKTLRYEGEAALSRRAGVYLTSDELAELRAMLTGTDTVSRPRSIRMRVPGVCYASRC